MLVPLITEKNTLHVLFFERTHDVIDHKGEICFPGGAIETGDAGPEAAALREAGEELGLRPQDVEILGLLDDVDTKVSGYVITPVVGHLGLMPALVPDPLEVARPIIVALEDLLAPGREHAEFSEYGGAWRERYWYLVKNGRIWGATGRIVHGFLSVLKS